VEEQFQRSPWMTKSQLYERYCSSPANKAVVDRALRRSSPSYDAELNRTQSPWPDSSEIPASKNALSIGSICGGGIFPSSTARNRPARLYETICNGASPTSEKPDTVHFAINHVTAAIATRTKGLAENSSIVAVGGGHWNLTERRKTKNSPHEAGEIF
jgi:hypothetical protein